MRQWADVYAAIGNRATPSEARLIQKERRMSTAPPVEQLTKTFTFRRPENTSERHWITFVELTRERFWTVQEASSFGGKLHDDSWGTAFVTMTVHYAPDDYLYDQLNAIVMTSWDDTKGE